MIVIIKMITMIVMIVVIIISIVILMEELREGIVRPRCLRKHYEHVLTIYYPPIYSTLHCNSSIVQKYLHCNSSIVQNYLHCHSTIVQ